MTRDLVTYFAKVIAVCVGFLLLLAVAVAPLALMRVFDHAAWLLLYLPMVATYATFFHWLENYGPR